MNARFAIRATNIKYIRFYYGEFSAPDSWIEYIMIDGVSQIMMTFIPVNPGLHIEPVLRDSSLPYELTIKVYEYSGDYEPAALRRLLADNNISS